MRKQRNCQPEEAAHGTKMHRVVTAFDMPRTTSQAVPEGINTSCRFYPLPHHKHRRQADLIITKDVWTMTVPGPMLLIAQPSIVSSYLFHESHRLDAVCVNVRPPT